MLLVTWHLLIGCSFSFTIYFLPTVLVAQSCPTLCDPIDCSPPGSSVHGILQARILEWVAVSFPRGSSGPRDQTGTSSLEADPNHWTTREFPGVFKCKETVLEESGLELGPEY